MSTLKDLTNVISQARKQVINTKGAGLTENEVIRSGEGATGFGLLKELAPEEPVNDNKLYLTDNLRLMKTLAEKEGYAGKVQMIYLDPPFYSGASHDAVVKVGSRNIKHPAYDDKWRAGLYEYLKQLTSRLILMRELLADDGLIWLHLDWHVVHYARVIMDEIFGEKQFVNEIIWQYKSGGSTRKRFSRKHDNILVYSKTGSYQFFPLEEKSYNRQFKPYRFKGVKEYQDELGWYTLVNMKDVWSIDMVGRTSAERTGYATQKPEQLIERMVNCCTKPGDLVADFFCGSGTLPAVAVRTGRRFLACDKAPLAVESTATRLASMGAGFSVYSDRSLPELLETGAQPRFEADAEIVRESIPGSGQDMITVRLKSVRERRLDRAMAEDDRKLIRKTVKKDPLALIDAWSVDFDFDGKVHRPAEVLSRKRGNFESACTILVSAGEPRRIMIKVSDVMGNTCYLEESAEAAE